MADILEAFLKSFELDKDTVETWRLWGTIISSAVVVYPQCLIKDMSGIAIFSLLSTVSIIYVFVLVVV